MSQLGGRRRASQPRRLPRRRDVADCRRLPRCLVFTPERRRRPGSFRGTATTSEASCVSLLVGWLRGADVVTTVFASVQLVCWTVELQLRRRRRLAAQLQPTRRLHTSHLSVHPAFVLLSYYFKPKFHYSDFHRNSAGKFRWKSQTRIMKRGCQGKVLGF